MRQWHVNPTLLCRKHLLGEHVEHHMFIGTLSKKKSLKGYIDKGFVEVHTLVSRHEILVNEMENRGYNHQSHLPTSTNDLLYKAGKVNRTENLIELHRRCPDCRKRIMDKIIEYEFKK